MLSAFNSATITLAEARQLVKYIKDSSNGDYKLMHELGIYKIYDELRDFVKMCDHYESEIKYFGKEN